MNTEKLRSKCCKAEMRAECADEGTCCYICQECKKPCAFEGHHICECGNYKKAGFPTCFTCREKDNNKEEDPSGNFTFKP